MGSVSREPTLGITRIDRVIENTLASRDWPMRPIPSTSMGATRRSTPHLVPHPHRDDLQRQVLRVSAVPSSLDNLDFVSAAALVDSLKLYLLAIEKLELDLAYRSLHPYSEPMLGKARAVPVDGRLHQAVGGQPGETALGGFLPDRRAECRLWQRTGCHSLGDVHGRWVDGAASGGGNFGASSAAAVRYGAGTLSPWFAGEIAGPRRQP